METIGFAIFGGFLLDLLLGDPHWLYHPVRMIGNLVLVLEKVMRRYFCKTKTNEIYAGSVLVVLVLFCSGMSALLILYIAYQLSDTLAFFVQIFMCYQILAMKSLKVESMKVYIQLKKQDKEGAKKAVSMIVGRDTNALDEVGIAKAAIETVAENSCDGVIAPLLYLILGGPILGFLYKAVNTMDSMIGYKNANYLYFGRCAAKLDDICNYLPSRMCGLLLIAASFLLRMDYKQAWKIFRRDRFAHASPNAAQSEAAVAGALGIQLAGDAYYFGEYYHKATIGDAIKPVAYEDIKRVNHLLYMSSILALFLLLTLRFVSMWIWKGVFYG